MKKPLGIFVAGVLGVAPTTAMAQVALEVRSAALFESYKFDAGLPFSKVSEFTVPVGITIGLGRFGNFAISS